MTEILVCTFVSIIVAVLLVYFRNIRKLVADHNTEMMRMNSNYETNRSQINKRVSGLDSYDFLAYNLQQSLIVQPGISINV